MNSSSPAEDRAKLLLQCLGDDLSQALREVVVNPPETCLLDCFRRLFDRYEFRVLADLSRKIPKAIPALLFLRSPEQAATDLLTLPEQEQASVLREAMTLTPEETLGALAQLAVNVCSRCAPASGLTPGAAILNRVPRADEKRLLAKLEELDLPLREKLRKELFVFEDLVRVNDKGIQRLLREIDNETFALAMKTASKELKEKMWKNMSQRAGTLLREDMECMGSVRVADLERAQQMIVEMARRLEEAGELFIQRLGQDPEITT